MKTFNQDKKLTKEEIDVINKQKVFGKTLDELENYSIKDLYNFIKDHLTLYPLKRLVERLVSLCFYGIL